MAQGTDAATIAIGRIGIWSGAIRYAPNGAGIAAAVELEELGFPTIWVPGGVDSGVLESLDQLLDATSTVRLGSSILNVWKHEPADVASWWAGQSAERRSRLILGLGVSHGPLIGAEYERPLAKMTSYLDALEAAGLPLQAACVAALGPKMLELAARRTAGACPFLVTPGHTAAARAILGPGKLLAPEQGVVLESDPQTARARAREVIQVYVGLPNYTNNWLRGGFTQKDIDTLSDRLIDGLVAWGDLDAIAARIREHLDAGADHVALQAIGEGGMMRPLSEDQKDWREFAKLL